MPFNVAYKGLENYSRVTAEEEMALSVLRSRMIGHVRDTNGEKGAERRGHKTRRLVWN